MNFMDARLPDRFWQKCIPEPTSGCWLWLGAHVWNEYGVIRVERANVYAHRFAYQRACGEVPAGLDLDHRCRVRCCVNPRHLEPVTRQENLRRSERGQTWGTDTHCRHGHEYTVENTGPRFDRLCGRTCRECNRLKQQKCQAKKRAS